jgi:hypothetical protein
MIWLKVTYFSSLEIFWKILTEEALKFRGNIGPSRCSEWLGAAESSSPLLLKSAFASKVWFLWRTWTKQAIPMVNTMEELFEKWGGIYGKPGILRF